MKYFISFLLGLGLNVDQAKMALKELAHFHALGMVLSKKNPKFFEEAKRNIDNFPWTLEEENWDDAFDYICDMICEDEKIAMHETIIKKTVNKNKNLEPLPPVEPWITIAHGDFWTNNILFKTGK